MGSKRRKSKPSRRQATPAKEKVAANGQEINFLDADESAAKKDAVCVVDEPPQEQLSPATDRVDEAVSLANAGGVPMEAPILLEDEDTLPIPEANQVLELFVVSLLAANISPLAAFCNGRSRALRLTELEGLLLQQLHSTDFVELNPRQRAALRSICPESNGIVDVSPFIELVGAATFRVEILEFQIRQAILDRSSSKSRGRVDVQRSVAKLSASFPQDAPCVTSADFETILEEKLGVSTGSNLLSRVVFARIAGLPLTHKMPKSMQSPKETFFAALEAFVADKPLSLESVEGQLRHLVSNHADLHASFKALDTDNSGAITVDEIVAFLQHEAHMQYPRDVIAAFVKRFDVDGDGTLSVEEFIAFVSPKQFGIQVLTPFGLFYHGADRHEPMKEVVAKIKTRMFWMQHNDLFATSTQPVYKPPLKLKVSDHFVLTHHYGKLRLRFKENDPIASVVKNGELVVLVMDPPVKSPGEDGQLPEFEYRLKPNIKRSIPPLMSWAMDGSQNDVAPSITVKGTKKSSHSRKVSISRGGRASDRASDRLSLSLRSERTEDEGGSVVSNRSIASSRMTTTNPRAQRIAAKASQPVMEHANADRTASTGKEKPTRIKDEALPATTPSGQETLVVAVEPQAPLPFSAQTTIDSVTEYDDHEYYDDSSSADEDDTEEEQSANVFHNFSRGDECGPPEELGDATVDCDEEEPPPAYDS